MFSARTLIKHYTPPTCTLEIHRDSSLFFRNNNTKIPEQFRFNLHFDDPKLPDEKRVTIKGDRFRLDLLSEIINEYVNDFLKIEEDQNVKKVSKNEDNKELNNDIYFVKKGLLNQELYYFSRDKNNIETTVKLTTLQLFDLANALEKYTLDLNNPEEDELDVHKKSTLISLTAMVLVSMIFGGIWWYDRQIMARNDQQNGSLEEEEFPSVLDEIEPPQPLDPETIPSVPQLQLPPNLQNRKTLPPPSPILAQPPNQQNNTSNNNQLPPVAKPSQTNNQKPKTIVIPPPPTRPLPPPPSYSESMPTSSNVIAINPQPSSSNLDTNPRFSSLPVLQSNSSITPPDNIDAGLNNNVSVLPQNINRIPSSFNPPLSQPQVEKINSSGQTATSTEVKKYFQKKWQPPENLTQSIEYRLVVNNDGSLQRVTPMGQASTTFLDRTGMPLMGEAIASSLPENKPSTVRLILRPNGDVETFLE